MSANANEDAQPDISEQLEAPPPKQSQYRSDIAKSKNPNTEPRARHTSVWVQLGQPPSWHECKVSAARDNPKERGKKQYQLVSTEPKGLDIGGGQWYAGELLWDWDKIPTQSKQTKS